MARIELLEAEQLDDEQLSVYTEIISGPRASMRGPFQPWLRSPSLASHAQKLGEYCRFNSSLESRLSELAILLTAKYWVAQFEWYAHEPLAKAAGLDGSIIESIRTGKNPNFKRDDEKAIYTFVMEYYTTKRVSTDTYKSLKLMLGERGLVDLVGILGYYALVSITLNVFEISPPDDSPPPLDE